MMNQSSSQAALPQAGNVITNIKAHSFIHTYTKHHGNTRH